MKAIAKIANWISNGNDCEHCPAGWSEACHTECGTEYDGGCYIYGDCYPEPCHLFLPKFLRAFLSRRQKYLEGHQHDGFEDWYQKQEEGREKMRAEIESAMQDYLVFWKGQEGKGLEINTSALADRMAFVAQLAYDDFLRQPRKIIRKKWAELIRETISIPVDFIKSYFGK